MVEAAAKSVFSLSNIPLNEKIEIEELYRSAILAGNHAELTGAHGKSINVPSAVYRLLVQILKDLTEGGSVSIIPATHGLTTSQASRMLGTSRQFFVDLLESEETPVQKGRFAQAR